MESSVQKISKALKRLLKWTESHTGIYSIQVSPKRDDPKRVEKEKDRAISQARKALALPMRNCDVGTAEEQAVRFDAFVRDRRGDLNCTGKCPAHNGVDYGVVNCVLQWEQMPYAK